MTQQQVLLMSGNETDPYIANVVLLMHCQDPLNQNFTDTTGRHTFTYNGSPTGPLVVVTHTFDGQTKCGQNSRTVAQYLTVADNLTDFAFGTGDFTIEAKVWGTFASATPANGLFTTAPFAPGGAYGIGLQLFSNVLMFTENGALAGAYWSLTSGNAADWNDIALVRISGAMTCYYNGVAKTKTVIGLAPENRDYTATPTLVCHVYSGGDFATAGAFDGFFTEFRVTKGVGRYTGNYTPRTAPFPNA